jgi:hypothetical protein
MLTNINQAQRTKYHKCSHSFVEPRPKMMMIMMMMMGHSGNSRGKGEKRILRDEEDRKMLHTHIYL